MVEARVFFAMNFRRFSPLLLLGVCLLSSAAVADEGATIEKLLQPKPRPGRVGPLYNNKPDLERSRVLTQLWRERDTRDITPELLVFLDDPSVALRESAARFLGELECAQAEAPLQNEVKREEEHRKKILDQFTQWQTGDRTTPPPQMEGHQFVSRFTLRLALGRIRSHNFQGRAKLDRIANEFGLDYDGIVKMTVELGRRLDDDARKRGAYESEGNSLALAFIDTLYLMGKAGEDLSQLEVDKMAFAPGLVLRLKGASLSSEDEAKMWLDHATGSKMGIFYVPFLLDIGPVAVELLFQRLNDISTHPTTYGISKDNAPLLGLRSLFEAATQSGDSRAVAVLEKFRNSDNEQVRGDAARSLEMARSFTTNNAP